MCSRAFWTVLPCGSSTAFFGVTIIFALMQCGILPGGKFSPNVKQKTRQGQKKQYDLSGERRQVRNSKLQAPSSNIQRSTNHQMRLGTFNIQHSTFNAQSGSRRYAAVFLH